MNNYILCINKEIGMTSHDVVNRLRKILNTKRIGHTGTLDPLASGVLLVCVNEATKLVQFLEADTKEYIVEMLIGKFSDTYDITGNITEEKEVSNLNIDTIDKVLNSFLGESLQVPPIYSAIKLNGQKLYEYARKNEKVNIEPRKIYIREIERISELEKIDNFLKFSFRCLVSKGTYVRSLCVDIGKKLGYPGLMLNLKRTKVGNHSIENSFTLKEVEEGIATKISMLEILDNYPKTDDEFFINKAKNGMKFSLNNIKDKFGEFIDKFIIYQGEELLGIYEIDNEKHCYRAVRIWN